MSRDDASATYIPYGVGQDLDGNIWMLVDGTEEREMAPAPAAPETARAPAPTPTAQPIAPAPAPESQQTCAAPTPYEQRLDDRAAAKETLERRKRCLANARRSANWNRNAVFAERRQLSIRLPVGITFTLTA